MLDYLGMKSYPPFGTYAAPRINAAGREAYLRQWRARVLEIAADLPAALQRGLSIRRREYRT